MITYIKGKLTYLDPAMAVIEANGIGYEIKIPLGTYSAIKTKEGDICTLKTHLQVREDAHTLYGFATEPEKETFRLLISVSGVGANTALMFLSSLSPDEIAQAITTQNEGVIKSVKGVGAKTAQRVIVDLKDKISVKIGGASADQPNMAQAGSVADDAIAALLALGISKAQAEKSVRATIKKAGAGLSVEYIIKQALQQGMPL